MTNVFLALHAVLLLTGQRITHVSSHSRNQGRSSLRDQPRNRKSVPGCREQGMALLRAWQLTSTSTPFPRNRFCH